MSGRRETEPSWESSEPFLRAGYAPVHDELDAGDLQVTGRLPPELSGVYIRNGPNPAFPPISYTYPFDGDGMLHAVYIEGGKARYRNRYVATRGLAAERRAGRSIYGGIMAPVPVAPDLIEPDGDPGPFKNGAFIHVIGHAGRTLAMWEGGPAYEVTRELETLGEWCPSTATPLDVGPHTRLDPATGELYLINYAMEPPYVQVYVMDSAGTLRQRVDVDLPAATMMHDFVLTEHHVVLFHFPLVIDITAPTRQEPLLSWRPELGTRIGLIARSDLTGGVRWIEIDPFFAFHFANGFERNGHLIVDYVRMERLALGVAESQDSVPPTPPAMHRLTLDLTSEKYTSTPAGTPPTEFPRTNETLSSRPSRYVYAPVRRGPPPGEGEARVYRGLAKFDCERGGETILDLGDGEIGEAVFVPRPNPRSEDDGWLMSYVYWPREQASDFCLFEARSLQAGPVASVRLPRRVPHGLHGSWFPG